MSHALDLGLVILSLQFAAFAVAEESVTEVFDPGDGTELFRVVVHKTPDPISWTDASAQASDSGGNLLAPATAGINQQAADLAGQIGGWECTGPWLGILRVPSTDSIDVGWTQSDSSTLGTIQWSADSPAGAPRLPWYVAFDARTGIDGTWVNTPGDPYFGSSVRGLVIRFSLDAPDCDQDGFPDGFEIQFFEAIDADGNGIPDDCGVVSGDISGDGAVNGLDLAILLAAWATSAEEADLDQDGIVGPEDLTILLASWTG